MAQSRIRIDGRSNGSPSVHVEVGGGGAGGLQFVSVFPYDRYYSLECTTMFWILARSDNELRTKNVQ